MKAGPTASSPTQATRTTGESASRAAQPAVSSAPTAEAAPAALTSIQRGLVGGSSLPADLRARMEAGFGTSFAEVRVHTGADAAGATASLQAEARVGFGHCERMAWVEGRWVIDAGIVPAWAPSTWPGSQKAAEAGWRPWVIEGVQR